MYFFYRDFYWQCVEAYNLLCRSGLPRRGRNGSVKDFSYIITGIAVIEGRLMSACKQCPQWRCLAVWLWTVAQVSASHGADLWGKIRLRTWLCCPDVGCRAIIENINIYHFDSVKYFYFFKSSGLPYGSPLALCCDCCSVVLLYASGCCSLMELQQVNDCNVTYKIQYLDRSFACWKIGISMMRIKKIITVSRIAWCGCPSFCQRIQNVRWIIRNCFY